MTLHARRTTVIPLTAFSDQVWYMKAIFIILKPYNFPLRVFCKSDLRISMVGKHEGIIIMKNFQPRNTRISSTLLWSDKVSMVPLWIRHCHLCMEGHLKLRVSRTVPWMRISDILDRYFNSFNNCFLKVLQGFI